MVRVKRYLIPLVLFSLLAIVLALTGCQTQDTKKVVVYTSVDQVFSEPVFKSFEAKTGIRVLPVYDVEATKTTGLVNRIIAEKNRPQADVFWSGEVVQTILLKEKGLLSAYRSANASDMPAQYVDSQGYWTGLAARARTLLINTSLVQPSDYPKSIFDLTRTKIPGSQIGIAYPLFGTAATESAALYAYLGPDKARNFYQDLKNRGVRVVDGASVVREMVSSGQLSMGMLDTDDAIEAIKKSFPVKMVFLDQDGMGTIVIPNTVAMIAGASHSSEAKQFIDYLLSHETAEALVQAGWSHIPLRVADPRSDSIKVEVKRLDIGLQDVYSKFEMASKELAEVFLR